MEKQKEEIKEIDNKVIAFPGVEKLKTLSIGELTSLRIKVERFDEYLRSLLKEKFRDDK